MAPEIDLDPIAGKGTVRNLAGKERGEHARRALKIDELDQQAEPVIVKVPEYLFAISSSFFLGLFSPSVVKYGSQEAFLNKYRFKASSIIMKQIMHGINRAMAPKDAHLPRD